MCVCVCDLGSSKLEGVSLYRALTSQDDSNPPIIHFLFLYQFVLLIVLPDNKKYGNMLYTLRFSFSFSQNLLHLFVVKLCVFMCNELKTNISSCARTEECI